MVGQLLTLMVDSYGKRVSTEKLLHLNADCESSILRMAWFSDSTIADSLTRNVDKK